MTDAVGTNVHMYPSAFTHETRMLRISRSLAEHRVFDRVLVVAALRGPQLEREALDRHRDVWRVRTAIARSSLLGKVLNTVEWSVRALWGLRRERIVCVNAHALSVLPLAALLATIKRCRLVYDAHEIETETTETHGVRQRVSRWVERVLMRRVDCIALTSPGHADWYRAAFPEASVWLVRNCPYRASERIASGSRFRSVFGIPDDHLVFLYQGAITPPRGTDLLLDVFATLPPDRHIVFMGFGPGEARVRALAETHPHIHFHPAVAPDQVRAFTEGADVGIHMMDDSCVNHLYALPNKPMEYMNAGLPAIVSALPTMGALIREAGAGWVVPVGDAAALRALVLSIDRTQIDAAAAGARAWASANTWETEELVLLDMYRRLGFQPRGEAR